MKTAISITIAALTLVACATPVTTLQHPKTKALASCGGGTAGSIAGGMVGYSIQQDNDAECVKKYESQGYKVQQTTTSSMRQ